jgi:hypothetical protein
MDGVVLGCELCPLGIVRFFGHYKNNVRHGPGVEYRADRSVARSGVWTDGAYNAPLTRAHTTTMKREAAAVAKHLRREVTQRLAMRAAATKRERRREAALKLIERSSEVCRGTAYVVVPGASVRRCAQCADTRGETSACRRCGTCSCARCVDAGGACPSCHNHDWLKLY